MTTIVSRNTIQLASTASNIDNFYVGYTVEFTRLYKATGKKSVQRGIIQSYNGANKIATISILWMEDVVPGPEDSTKLDTYKIIPTYADNRVSINPAIQTLDYITSIRYGLGLNVYKDLYLPSWLESARLCDAQSDVTVETTSAAGVVIGDRYRYPQSGDLLFQGDVLSVSGNFVTFTNVLGKLTNMWNSWKTFPINSIIYDQSRTYLSLATGVSTAEPVHTSGTVNSLQYLSSPWNIYRVSGTGPTTLALPADGNPVRSWKNGAYATGYSLYDADGVNYWRYLGWDEHAQRYATQHQTNLEIDTSQPVLDNTNGLLAHFGGMLRYTAGKYYLEVEDAEGDILTDGTDPRYITTADILTKLKLSDTGIKSAYNSLSVAFADPSNKFEARNISFFNSEYLKIDRNVPKKGNLTIPGITNYYNARLLSERYLTKSRYGLTVSFNMTSKGALLIAGRVISIPYARYGWTGKKFRISNITHNPDTTVDVVATEYDDSFYEIKAVMQRPAVGRASGTNNSTIGSPTNLVASNVTNGNETVSAILLEWQNTPNLDPSNIVTEIHTSNSPNYFITFTNIAADGITITTSMPHGLIVGSTLTPISPANGISIGNYYVVAVPTSTTLQISSTLNGPAVTLTPGAINIQVSTATVLDTVSYPGTTFIDNRIPSSNQLRVTRYYWVRYRIN